MEYIVPLDLCEYHKKTKQLRLASEFFGIPPKITIVSNFTGRSVEFVPIGPEDPNWCPDSWDGEMCMYRPVDKIPNIDYLVIYNEY